MRALPYLTAYLIPVSAMVGGITGGYFTFLTPFMFFLVLPIADEFVARDTMNAAAEDEAARLQNPIYNLLVRGWLPAQLATIGLGLWLITGQELTLVEAIGMTLSVGIVGGAGINVAHELMHRQAKLDKGLAECLMSSVSYTHFCVEHVYGHHKNVSTPHDPATSRLGESVYPFLVRSIFGGLLSFFHIEKKLAARRKLSRYSLKDRRVRYAAVLISTYLFVGAAFGAAALAFYIAQGVVAFTLLEVINYLEHYGLEREELSAGRYERVEPHHSWSSSHRLTNWILFGLPRHADHHSRAARPYPILRHFDDTPQLPAGYSAMLLLALCPPLWRMVMDPRVEALKTQANAPAKKSAYTFPKVAQP